VEADGAAVEAEAGVEGQEEVEVEVEVEAVVEEAKGNEMKMRSKPKTRHLTKMKKTRWMTTHLQPP